MASARRLHFVRVQLAGMLASILALVLLDALSLELFFVCSLLVLLVATELTDPLAIKQPRTGEYLRLDHLSSLGDSFATP